MRRPKSSWEEPPINLTPLIDVVFVLLIAFIMIAPILNTEHVELAGKPSDLSDPASKGLEARRLQITVRNDNSVWIGQQRVELAALQGQLRRCYLDDPECTPLLIHDRTAYFGTYQCVRNACQQAGFHSLDVLLKPEVGPSS